MMGMRPELCEELGDLLLQVYFHAQIAAEEAAFTFADVTAALGEKLVRRHPHVFGDQAAADDSPGLHNPMLTQPSAEQPWRSDAEQGARQLGADQASRAPGEG